MKTLLTISTLVFTVMFSSTSFAGWTKVGESVKGNTFYVDYERIRKHGGYVYFWMLSAFLKPEEGISSMKTEIEVDCGTPRKYRGLRRLLYKEPMGEGKVVYEDSDEEQEWSCPTPDSIFEAWLKIVCAYLALMRKAEK